MPTEEWLRLIMGQGGIVVVLLAGCIYGFKYFTKMIEKQDTKDEERSTRFYEMHKCTIQHIVAQTEVMRTLGEKISGCTSKDTSGSSCMSHIPHDQAQSETSN